MITLIYGSSAARNMTDAELLDILQNSKANNDKIGITGMLLYKGGNFLQVLEGEEAAVDKLYAKIQKDPRHQAVMTILKRPIKEREFGDWTMGFVNLDNLDVEDVSGYTNYLSKPFDMDDFQAEPSFAYTFLKNFKTLMR